MSGELATKSDLQQSVLYKLRLNKLDTTSRVLQKAGVIDNNGFLTVEGFQVFVDAMWQAHPELQKEIAEGITAMNKEEKKAKKNAD
jgi:hypothetical protein